MPGIFLIGFMASGKTQVARILATQMSMPFVDLDTLVETTAGQSVAAIFASKGEAEFRKLESLALAEVLSGKDAVVATGGGSACHSGNLKKMKSAGTVIHLATELTTALARAKNEKQSRPLLTAPIDEIEELYRSRAQVYRRAHLSVSTESKTPESVSSDIEMALSAGRDLPAIDSGNISLVALRERSYPVVVKSGSLQELGELIASKIRDCRRVGLVSDDNVMALYGERVRESIEAAGIRVESVSVAPGETSKEIGVFQSICEKFIDKGLDRNSVIVALGGGVVGDLSGFVAASLFRGISLVQVPTTLLAMTDSSIGGKTGVNSCHGKNLIGAFWQPAFVLADPSTLATLPARERIAAFGELVKYALLDEEIWPLVANCASSIGKAGDGADFEVREELCQLIRSCVALKAAIVSADERERGLRATLNLGHTVGHAIESASGFGHVLHGEAVALGLLATCRVSYKLGYCSENLESEVSALLAVAGLDVKIDSHLTKETLSHMSVDKKRTGSSVRFVVVSKPGDVRLHRIGLNELIDLLSKD